MLCFDVRFDEQMEEILDQAYERFVTKREGSTKQRKRAKLAYAVQLLEV
jgi:AdoMet-dependent rRNA methyltransferase SPB1